MAISNIKAELSCDIQTAWNIVTCLDDCSWRSGLDRIEILGENRFAEYTKDGFKTIFTVTAKEPCRLWEFDMENDRMKGHFKGMFKETNGKTTVDLTEICTSKGLFLKPFVKLYLKKQQSVYVADLKRAVSSKSC